MGFGQLEQRRSLAQRAGRARSPGFRTPAPRAAPRRRRQSRRRPARPRSRACRRTAHRAGLVGQRGGIGLHRLRRARSNFSASPSPLSSRIAKRARSRLVGAVEQVEADRGSGRSSALGQAGLGGLHWSAARRADVKREPRDDLVGDHRASRSSAVCSAATVAYSELTTSMPRRSRRWRRAPPARSPISTSR